MNLSSLKIFGLNIKDYLVDIIFLFFWGLPSNLFIQWIYFSNLHQWLPKFDISPLSLDAIKIAGWIVSYLVIKSIYSWAKTKYSEVFPSKYSFNTDSKDQLSKNRFIKEWYFQGNPIVDNQQLLISNSNSGCLIKPTPPLIGISRIWRDFTSEIEFSFPKQEEQFMDYFGIIFRARNFEDYLMAEFAVIGNVLNFRPHLRLGGDWDAPINNIDKNKETIAGDIIKLKMEVKKETVKIYINGIYTFEWIIPTHIEPWMKQHAKKDGDGVSKTIIPELYFKNQAGMFGFRCYGNQRVLIHSFKIYPNS
jgi:hypothetical protein